MPVTIQTRFNGLKRTTGLKPTAIIDVIIKGSDDEDEMLEAMAEQAPSEYLDEASGIFIVVSDYSVTEQLTTELWIGQIKYGSEERNQRDGDNSVSFETTGGTQKIYQSKATVRYPPSAPDYKGAIGVTDDSIDGVDITVPVFQFSETWTLQTLTPDYANAIYRATGTVNKAPFRYLTEGECLFLGATGAKRDSGDWQITFRFAGSPTLTDLKIGDITGITKFGWQYLWVRYVKTTIGTGADKTPGMVPKYVYVETVYDETDFGQLRIGS